MFLLIRRSNKKPYKYFYKQSSHLYTGMLDFHSNKIRSNLSAPSKDKRSHIVFFSGYISPLFKLSFWWWGWVSTVVGSQ